MSATTQVKMSDDDCRAAYELITRRTAELLATPGWPLNYQGTRKYAHAEVADCLSMAPSDLLAQINDWINRTRFIVTMDRINISNGQVRAMSITSSNEGEPRVRTVEPEKQVRERKWTPVPPGRSNGQHKKATPTLTANQNKNDVLYLSGKCREALGNPPRVRVQFEEEEKLVRVVPEWDDLAVKSSHHVRVGDTEGEGFGVSLVKVVQNHKVKFMEVKDVPVEVEGQNLIVHVRLLEGGAAE